MSGKKMGSLKDEKTNSILIRNGSKGELKSVDGRKCENYETDSKSIKEKCVKITHEIHL